MLEPAYLLRQINHDYHRASVWKLSWVQTTNKTLMVVERTKINMKNSGDITCNAANYPKALAIQQAHYKGWVDNNHILSATEIHVVELKDHEEAITLFNYYRDPSTKHNTVFKYVDVKYTKKKIIC